MRKWYLALFSLFFALPAWSDVNVDALLNKVTIRLAAEQWVSTKTALVTVGINVSVSDNDLGKAQNQIMDKLNQLVSKADWHIVALDRSLDQSGLEKIQASAQARLADSALAGLREKAKSISKPGETFTLDNVQFIPSEEETRIANTDLRNNIYQQAKAELEQLNKLYPEQKYYLHQINFMNDLMPMPVAQNMMVKLAGAPNTAGLLVGDKLKISAIVVFAAAPNQDVVKVVHN